MAGKPADEALLVLLDWVAGDASTLDGQTARRSAEQVLSDLLQSDEDIFETPIDLAEAFELFRRFLTEYVTRTILTPLSKRITENAGANDARRHERDIRRVVEASVQLDLDAADFQNVDWFGDEGAAVVDRLYQGILELLAGD